MFRTLYVTDETPAPGRAHLYRCQNLQFIGPVPQPGNRNMFILLHLQAARPDTPASSPGQLDSCTRVPPGVDGPIEWGPEPVKAISSVGGGNPYTLSSVRANNPAHPGVFDHMSFTMEVTMNGTSLEKAEIVGETHVTAGDVIHGGSAHLR